MISLPDICTNQHLHFDVDLTHTLLLTACLIEKFIKVVNMVHFDHNIVLWI